MAFWTAQQTAATKDPKRKFRFTVSCTGIPGEALMWYAKTAAKPSFAIASTEHKYLNHTFYYPGSVTWNDVAITLVDPVDSPGDMTMTLSSFVEQAGYTIPDGAESLSTMTKGKAVGALGDVIIRQLDGAGNPLETWTLRNAWILDLKFGDLEYGADDLTELSMTLKYDWATCVTTNEGAQKETIAFDG